MSLSTGRCRRSRWLQRESWSAKELPVAAPQDRALYCGSGQVATNEDDKDVLARFLHLEMALTRSVSESLGESGMIYLSLSSGEGGVFVVKLCGL